MEKYLSLLRRGGAAQAAVIDPKTIVTAPWVAFKCQYGCPYYGKNLCCPPHAPASAKRVARSVWACSSWVLYSVPQWT